MITKTRYFLIPLLLLFVCCSKEDDKVSESDRAEAMLGQWKYEVIMMDKAVNINGDGTVNIDLFNTQEIRQCIKDNLTFFTEMGSNGNVGRCDWGMDMPEETYRNFLLLPVIPRGPYITLPWLDLYGFYRNMAFCFVKSAV